MLLEWSGVDKRFLFTQGERINFAFLQCATRLVLNSVKKWFYITGDSDLKLVYNCFVVSIGVLVS